MTKISQTKKVILLMSCMAHLFLLFVSQNLIAYPQVISIKNKPKIEFEQQKININKKNDYLKSAFHLKTEARDEVEIQFPWQQKIYVYPQSQLEVPDVYEKDETFYQVVMKSGRVRVRTAAIESQALSLHLKTPFFDLALPAELDAVVEVDLVTPKVVVQVIRGVWSLEFFAYEKKVLLKAREQVTFKGELNEKKDDILYDVLLKNQKIPKGQLSTVEAFNAESFFKAENEHKQAEIEQVKKKNLVEAQKLKKQREYEAGFLCHHPFGQKEDCAWVLIKNNCLRTRCNINGEWGDSTERPRELFKKNDLRCQKENQFTVQKCDY